MKFITNYPLLTFALFILLSIPNISTGSPWGKNYFPNVPLTTHNGDTLYFFDDLIKDKVVAINFIYTSCPDTCPLETAKLVRVQNILGPRLGDDIFFYSISIDPDVDTPEVLKEYKERFGAKWIFLTGKEADVTQLRKKLGLYIEEIQDGSNNHNVSMIIGNQATGQWMRRSPYENPYVLADQLGNWLTGWKRPPRGADYANAPALRPISQGEMLYRTRCSSCHTINGREPANALGPDLLNVTQRREMDWLVNWLRAPDQMLKDKDPIAMELYERYNRVAMPNMRLSPEDTRDIIAFMEEESARINGINARPRAQKVSNNSVHEHHHDHDHGHHHEHDNIDQAVTNQTTDIVTDDDLVAVMNAWVRAAHPKAKTNAGYMTLINVGEEDLTLTQVESDAFERIEVHEMAVVDGLMKMREIENLTIPASGQAKLSPGGKHLMLIGPRKHLKEKERIEMVLTFESGDKQKVSVKVASK